MPRGSKPKPPNRAGYRITTQPEGTRVSYWPDPRGVGFGDVWVGTIESHKGDTVLIVWDDDQDHYEQWDGAEIRYRVDRGQMNLKRPPKGRRLRIPSDELLCKVCGKPRSEKCKCKRLGAVKPEEWGQKVVSPLLTPLSGHDMMDISNRGNAPMMRKGHMMAKKAAEVIEELDELEEMGEATESVDSGDKLTAKQAATLLKTDGRTLRKFLRKKHGTIGQGQRWEIDEADMPALKAEFEAFGRGTKAEPKAPGEKAPAKPKAPKGKSTPPSDDEIYGPEVEALDNDALLDMEDIEDLDMD